MNNNENKIDSSKFFQTSCIHSGENYEDFKGGATPPIYANSLFTLPDYDTAKDAFEGRNNRYTYSRGSNPTVDILEKKLAELELAEEARVFSSGMAAITSSVLSRIETGDHIIVVSNCYSVDYQFFTKYLKNKFNVDITFVKGDLASFEENIREQTKLFYLESPTSVKLDLQDLESIVELADEHNITTIIDNSYSSPFNQNPHKFGVDLVIHSISKYINGHSDVVAGVVTGKEELIEGIGENEREIFGGIIDPFSAWLILRGIKTLGVRMEKFNKSGLEIAQFLEGHPRVRKVNYPALKSHPQHDLYKKQMRGAGGLMSFELDTMSPEKIKKFVNSLEYISIAVSWGGYESLILPIYTPLKESLPEEMLKKWGIKKNLIRLCIGLEDCELLKADLEVGLDKL